MQYAVVNGNRTEAFYGGIGACPTCGAAMVAKCGPRVIHHWAHRGRSNCDLWWENETDWHRAWKNLYPAECREINHVAPDGEVHRADIKSPTGIYIEVQHSAITDAERISRELFYKNLVWLIDGTPFRKNFDIHHALPDPHSELAQDLVWIKSRRGLDGANHGIFMSLSEMRKEDPALTKASLRGGYIYGIHQIQNEVNAAYSGHHQFDWVRPRSAWLETKAPVFIDFGEDHLMQLMIYDESGLPCVRYVSKRKFLHDTMTETDVRAIATRFYPLAAPN